jgi:hypothetical protein
MKTSNNVPIGAHLVTNRGVYKHHGIYAGKQRVIHYAGLADGLNAGPVEEVSLEQFTDGLGYSIKPHPKARFTGEQVVGRARSRVGEKRYDVASNNCEHFCEWCVNDHHHSGQVDRGTAAAGSVVATVAGLAGRAVVAVSGTVAGVSGPGVMSGLASVGGFVGGGVIVGVGVLGGAQGAAAASLVNNTVLKDNPKDGENERHSKAIGRIASYVGAAAGTAGGIGATSTFGSVAGVSAAGISSGLASIGALVGGGMVGSVAVVTAAPVILAVAGGYGVYKLAKYANGSDSPALGTSHKQDAAVADPQHQGCNTALATTNAS